MALLARKSSHPEERHLVLAGVGALVGGAVTFWRDHVRGEERHSRS